MNVHFKLSINWSGWLRFIIEMDIKIGEKLSSFVGQFVNQ